MNTTRRILTPGPDHPISITAHDGRVQVMVDGRTVADSRHALRLDEAAYAPVFYLPIADVDMTLLERSAHASYCPYKGDCTYYDLKVGERLVPNAVWHYAAPYAAVQAIADRVAFYADRVDAILVDDAPFERAAGHPAVR
ncbi:MAG: DUF427 domain-containing protein [Massilia sp.]